MNCFLSFWQLFVLRKLLVKKRLNSENAKIVPVLVYAQNARVKDLCLRNSQRKMQRGQENVHRIWLQDSHPGTTYTSLYFFHLKFLLNLFFHLIFTASQRNGAIVQNALLADHAQPVEAVES